MFRESNTPYFIRSSSFNPYFFFIRGGFKF